MLAAGKLRHRIELQTPVPSRNSYGESTETWTTRVTVWAEIEPAEGREYNKEGQERAEVTHLIRVRYLRRVTPRWRVKFGSRLFNIERVLNVGEKNEALEMQCRERVI